MDLLFVGSDDGCFNLLNFINLTWHIFINRPFSLLALFTPISKVKQGTISGLNFYC